VATVLHMIDTTGPGGAEAVFADLIEHLPPPFAPVPVVAGDGWVKESLSARGIESITVSSAGRSRARYLHELVQVARRVRADLVHAHLLGSAVYGSVAARLAGIPAVCTIHGHADLPESDRFLNVRLRIVNRTASKVVFVSESLRRYVLSRTPLREALATVIHNGVDTEAFSRGRSGALRAELGLPRDTVVIGALGNVRAPKGYAILLEALVRIQYKQPWHLVIAGDTRDDTYSELTAVVRRLQLASRVTFLGFREDVADVLASLDVFVLSSTAEGFSLATVQALAAGLPVVVTRSGGPEEIVKDGENGLLVPTHDPAALAAAIDLLLVDEALRKRLATAGMRDIGQRFSLNAMVNAYARLYEAVIGTHLP
jgi:glycosyltransferase involved in cell wall biosynthesis